MCHGQQATTCFGHIAYTFNMAYFWKNKSNPKGGVHLGDAWFTLVENNDLVPCWLFGKSKICFTTCLGPPLDVDVHPTKQYMARIFVDFNHELTTGTGSTTRLWNGFIFGNNYVMTIGNFLRCNCLDFLWMI
jgi:hypothetical protein